MLNGLFLASVVVAIVLGIAYFMCLSRLYDIVDAEKPEWLKYKGEPSIFYANMPRRFDPNVSLRVLAVAFGPKARLLTDTSAYIYAKAIRISLPMGLLLFAFIFWYVLTYAEA